MTRLLAIVSLAMAAACGHGATPGNGSGSGSGSGSAAVPAVAPPLVTDVASAEANVGNQAEVRGIADDAKLGAVVTSGKLIVYCLGTDRWPAELAGKTVAARGKLEHTDEFAEESDPALPPSAGTTGAVWVLRSCVYEARP